jgi:hypothetical protein
VVPAAAVGLVADADVAGAAARHPVTTTRSADAAALGGGGLAGVCGGTGV